MDLTHPTEHRTKIKESEKRYKYLDLARKFLKAEEDRGDDHTNCNWCAWNTPERLERKAGGIRNQRKNRDYRIVQVG